MARGKKNEKPHYQNLLGIPVTVATLFRFHIIIVTGIILRFEKNYIVDFAIQRYKKRPPGWVVSYCLLLCTNIRL